MKLLIDCTRCIKHISGNSIMLCTGHWATLQKCILCCVGFVFCFLFVFFNTVVASDMRIHNEKAQVKVMILIIGRMLNISSLLVEPNQ